MTSPSLYANAIHDLADALRAKETHEVVFQGHVELRATAVALTACTTAQLPVDSAGFMALGADDGETASLLHIGAELDVCNHGQPCWWRW